MKILRNCCIVLLVIFFGGCSPPLSPDNQPPIVLFKACKWYGGKTAAISITYDAAWGMKEVLSRGLRMDMECVTRLYQDSGCDQWLNQMSQILIPKGIHFFGHGHYHYDFDTLSYDKAKSLMQLCYILMQQWGLKPRAYAYPYARCRQKSTRDACRDAGFICGRSMEWIEPKLFICADSVSKPVDWYYLPSVPMANDFDDYYQNHFETLPLLQYAEAHSAWLIFTFHNIGLPGEFGYYNWNEFIKVLDYIKSRNFWVGNMDDIACYIKERNAFTYTITDSKRTSNQITYSITFSDNLDNSIYNFPLTVQLEIETLEQVKSAQFVQGNLTISFVPKNRNNVLFDVLPNEQSCTLTINLEE